ncbi:pentapeptide repeat-containing protein [Bradyrhizobium guangxiense]
MTWNDLIRRIRATAIWTRRSPAARAIKTWAEYLGKLAVVLGVLGFISERPERAKQRYYQAWQLINAAKQSLGDAGRRVAIRDLIDDHVEMRGIELNNSGFEGMDFRSAIMPNADFTQARLKDANFSCKAGFYINDYWVPAFRFCWPTVLDSAELATTISNDFTHASLHKTRLGPTLSTEQMEQLRTAQKFRTMSKNYQSIHRLSSPLVWMKPYSGTFLSMRATFLMQRLQRQRF